MTLLEADGLSVRFGGLRALDGVSFSVEEGSITAIIGPNGAGKTTCLNVLCGLQRPTAGRVRFRGEDVTALPTHRRTYLGRTFQIAQPFGGMTVSENVQVGFEGTQRMGLLRAALRTRGAQAEARAARESASALLSRLDLEPLSPRLVETLSLGHQRLVEFARALARDPALLFLDEAASGLSGNEVEELAAQVLRCRDQGRTVVLIEHNVQFVTRLADHLIVLDRGEVLYDGEPAAGLRDPGVISAYLGSGGADAAGV